MTDEPCDRVMEAWATADLSALLTTVPLTPPVGSWARRHNAHSSADTDSVSFLNISDSYLLTTMNVG